MCYRYCIIILLQLFILRSIALDENSNLVEESSLCAEGSVIDINNFGFSFLNKSVVHTGNIFISPLGTAWILGILYSVSANQTAQQIHKLLTGSEEIQSNGTKVVREFTQLLQNLRDFENKFGTLNQVLLKSHQDVKEKFKSELEKNNLAEIQFINDSKIDGFASDRFNNADSNSSNTTWTDTKPNVELINLVTYNDSWKVQFNVNRTKREYFYSGKRETTEVWMMSMEAETFKFYEDLEMKYKFIELPYQNGYRSMVLALPTQYDHPADLQLDTKRYCNIKSKMIPTKLDMVSIPKFQFDVEISLKDLLIEMGLEDVFNETTAELPGISDYDVYVSDIKELVTIDVNEDGGESAAITKLNFKTFAFRGVKEFIANHPFLFYIEDKITGTVVLSGRIDVPSESISFSEQLNF